MVAATAIKTTISQLRRDYAVLLLDAYGVLVDDGGARPGAITLLQDMQAKRQPYFIVSNGSSRTAEVAAAAYQDLGLPITAAQIVASGALLPAYFASHDLVGKASAVLGTSGSQELALRAGAKLVDLGGTAEFEVLIVANQGDYPFVPTLDWVISTIFARRDRGMPTTLILTNPDMIYPIGPNRYGMTAGAVARIIEAALSARYGESSVPSFVRLGKPYPLIFAAARERANSDSLVMIGDQIDTDIVGALSEDIAAALLLNGVSHKPEMQWQLPVPELGRAPFYLLESLALES